MCVALSELSIEARLHLSDDKIDLLHLGKVKLCARLVKLGTSKYPALLGST